MAHGIEKFVKLAPAIWPGEALEVQPGDLSLFAPMGIGLQAPMLMTPIPGDFIPRREYYGAHPHTGHPFSGAPITEPGGGTIYFNFNDGCERADIGSMLQLMGVRGHLTDYAAFLQEATKPEDRYLTQLRIVSRNALDNVFRVSDQPEGKTLRQQPLPISEVIWKFIRWFKDENAEWRYPVRGVPGGDRIWPDEELAFGFMVENSYHGIYRIWTRFWVCTQ